MALSNTEIATTIQNAVADAPNRGVPDWQAATDDLIEALVANGECFSSGEIAAHLRTFAPNLRFSVTSSVGEHVRNRFYGNTLPLYQNDDGTTSPVEQVPRTTQGFTRTPPGTQVFVYGPDYVTATAYDFEVDIPAPGTVPAIATDGSGLPARPTQSATPRQHAKPVTPRPATNLRVSVRTDYRVNVPRSAFEALLHATQTGLKGGDSVYVEFDDANSKAIIYLDPQPNARSYNLWATTGRIAIRHPVKTFNPGDEYAVEIDATNRRMVVDLSQTV